MIWAHYRRAMTAGLAAAAAGIIAGCASSGYAASTGSAGNGSQAAASGPVVSQRRIDGIGTVLVDRSGKTIYSPQQEADGMIRCTASCLGFWFPVTVTSARQAHAVKGLAGALGTIHRSDNGRTQLTYSGEPLYTFRLDTSAGQAHGNDFKDSFGGTTFEWRAVTVSKAHGGAKQTPAPASSYPSSGNGY